MTTCKQTDRWAHRSKDKLTSPKLPSKRVKRLDKMDPPQARGGAMLAKGIICFT